MTDYFESKLGPSDDPAETMRKQAASAWRARWGRKIVDDGRRV